MAKNTQNYDPYKLIDEIVAHLAEKGLTPERDSAGSRERMVAACALLTNLGIEPRLAAKDTPDLDGHLDYNRRIHGD